MILKKIEWLIKLTGKSGKWKMGRVGGEQRYPCQGSFPCWALAAASTTGTCLGTSHRCCEDWEGIAAPPCQPWAVLLSPRGTTDSHSQGCPEAGPRDPAASPCEKQAQAIPEVS